MFPEYFGRCETSPFFFWVIQPLQAVIYGRKAPFSGCCGCSLLSFFDAECGVAVICTRQTCDLADVGIIQVLEDDYWTIGRIKLEPFDVSLSQDMAMNQYLLIPFLEG